MVIEDTSLFIVVILAVGGISMMTALLACYVCVFRDLCCRSQAFHSTKNIRTKRINKCRNKVKDDYGVQQKYGIVEGIAEPVTLCDFTQQMESMPTESENL